MLSTLPSVLVLQSKILTWVLLLLAIIKCGDAAVEIISHPVSLNVTLGSFALFNCESQGGPVNWIINHNPDSSSWGEGIELANFHQNGLHFSSTIRVSATVNHNNSIIVCSAPGVQSHTARLKIQGLLAAPGNLRILSTSEHTMELKWEAPFTLNISGKGHGSARYLIIVRNKVTGDVFKENTTPEWYTFFRPIDSGPCDLYSISIVAVNAVGEGGVAIVQSAFKSDIQLWHEEQSVFTTLHCSVSCDSFGQILWFFNGSIANSGEDRNVILLKEWTDSQIKNKSSCISEEDSETNHHTNSIEVMTRNDISEPFTVYCASIMICTKEEGCVPTICFSNEITITANENQYLVLSTTETVMENLTKDEYYNSTPSNNIVCLEAITMNTVTWILLGMCITLFIILVVALIVCTYIVLVLSTKVRQCHMGNSCWDRPAVLHDHDLPMNLKGQCVEAIYEEPLTILQHPSPEVQMMQSCPAYEKI